MIEISRFDPLTVEMTFAGGIPAVDFDIFIYTPDPLSVPARARQRDGILYLCRYTDGRLYIDIGRHALGYGRVIGRAVLHVPASGDVPARDIVTPFETDYEIVDKPCETPVDISVDIAIKAVAPVPNRQTDTWWVAGQDTGIGLTVKPADLTAKGHGIIAAPDDGKLATAWAEFED